MKRYTDPKVAIEHMERLLDSADRLASSGKWREVTLQIRRARAIAYSYLNGGRSISQTSLWTWRQWQDGKWRSQLSRLPGGKNYAKEKLG